MRTNRVLLAAAASVAALTLAGCGGGDGGPKVPTAGGGTARASGTASTQSGGDDDMAAYVEAQRAYVTCLRDNGIDAPDPDARGNVVFGDDDLLALKKDAKFRAATGKCAEHQIAVPESVENGNQPSLSAEQIKVKRAYATCMQDNGAADFPDPGPDGLGQGEWDQSSASAKRAIRICGPIVGVPAGSGPGKG
ncbi:hypothetical protein OHT57_23660 [Streptomyces sp. NBC_00285]|uniref:hypothetical protein n=1 Tax=Streptomyces sp. NBC_00285 TaxID=2975700 RepID=UPI002E2B96B4|nr:hypothetical protein [Streptomyces sp. NBC_00285]